MSLGAGRSIEAVGGPVRIEFSVHIPAELLGSRLRVVELLLGRALH